MAAAGRNKVICILPAKDCSAVHCMDPNSIFSLGCMLCCWALLGGIGAGRFVISHQAEGKRWWGRLRWKGEG